jgi:membrane protein DedA with SNARE-associated domain
MNPLEWTGAVAYLAVFVATAVEGEVVFVGAAVLAQTGQLEPVGVLAAAALGGSAGDQAYFYAVRCQLKGRLDRFPAWASRRQQFLERLARHVTAMILACRFLPGLRIAIPAACALSDVSPLRFSVLNLVSSIAWASGIMGLVTWMGPAILAKLGVNTWWAPFLPALAILGASWRLSRGVRVRDEMPTR